MNYQDALTYLGSFINYEKKTDFSYAHSFSLERMRVLAGHMGDPHKAVRALHITGTKGKGSTAAYLQAILKGAGYKTGLYTSPHLVSFRERIRIDDELITRDELGRLIDEVKTAVDKMAGDRPTFFEVYTALAFLYFREKKADYAVYEVGMGGRLDATNIVEPIVTAITPISLEHTDKLGTTLGAIAGEKAGIIKRRVPCVSAPQEKEALDVIASACRAHSAKLLLVGEDLLCKGHYDGDTKEVFDLAGPFGEYKGLATHLLGEHQIVNAAVAVGIAETLKECGADISESAIRRGLDEARWPGRFEIVARAPYIVLDGAQNRASARSLATTVRRVLGGKAARVILVLGVSKDKDRAGIVEELMTVSDEVIVTRASVPERALDSAELAVHIPQEKRCAVTGSVAEALNLARGRASSRDLILVTGSLFVVGEARALELGVNDD